MFDATTDLYGFAHVASVHACSRANIAPHVRDDYDEDMRQEACIGLLRSHNKPKSYAFAAARNEVHKWIFGYLRNQRSKRRGDYERISFEGLNPMHGSVEFEPQARMEARQAASDHRNKTLALAPEVYDRLIKSKKRPGGNRAKAASMRDTKVIVMSLLGYHTSAIALVMGTSAANIRAYKAKAFGVLIESFEPQVEMYTEAIEDENIVKHGRLNLNAGMFEFV